MDTAAAAVWTDPDSPAVCLVALGLDRYLPPRPDPDQPSPINWTPGTWEAEIRDDCGVPPHPAAAHRLHAGLALLHSPDEFYRTAPGFHTLAEALASELFDPTGTHPLSAAEAAWAIVQAHCVSPPDRDPPFAPAVTRLVHRICREEGYARLPAVFGMLGVGPAGGTPGVSPEHEEMVAASLADLHDALAEWLRSRLLDLADRVGRLPLRRTDPAVVAAEIRRIAGG